MKKATVFIGSSVEGLKLANAIQDSFEHFEYADAELWSQGTFQLTSSALDDLLRKVEEADYGIFIFSPDDDLTIRGQQVIAARDNVSFEFGLFLGVLKKARCFFVAPQNLRGFHTLTDLLGVKPAVYDPKKIPGFDLENRIPPDTTIEKLGRILHKATNALQDAIIKIESKRQSCLGEWKCWWQPVVSGKPGAWEAETASIDRKRQRFVLRSKGKTFDWEGIAELFHDTHLVGEWHSKKSPARGGFVLTLGGGSGTFMWGYIVGANPGLEVKPSPFVLGRTRSDVREGMECLSRGWDWKFDIPTRLSPNRRSRS